MIFSYGQWITACLGQAMPIGFVLAFLDLLVNTCLNLCFGGYNTFRFHSPWLGGKVKK